MIDYSKYNLAEMRAIVTVLDDLTDEMSVVEGYEQDFYMALSEHMRAVNREKQLMAQMASEAEQAEQVDRIVQACIAGAPPAFADDPTPPDMFGWVGDALDGLEVKLSD